MKNTHKLYWAFAILADGLITSALVCCFSRETCWCSFLGCEKDTAVCNFAFSRTTSNLKEFPKSNMLQDHIWNAPCCRNMFAVCSWSSVLSNMVQEHIDLRIFLRIIIGPGPYLDHESRPKCQKTNKQTKTNTNKRKKTNKQTNKNKNKNKQTKLSNMNYLSQNM